MKMLDYLHERLDSLALKMESKLGRRKKAPGYAFMTCIIQVNSRKSGWQKAVLGVLKSRRGVGSFQLNEYGLVRISGIADPDELLRSLEKKGRRAKLVWFQYGLCSNNLFGPSLMNIYGAPPLPRLIYSCDRPKLPDREAEEDDEKWPPLSGEGITCCSLM